MKRMILGLASCIGILAIVGSAVYGLYRKDYCDTFRQKVYMKAYYQLERMNMDKCKGVTPTKAHLKCNDQLVEEMDGYDKAADDRVKKEGCWEGK